MLLTETSNALGTPNAYIQASRARTHRSEITMTTTIVSVGLTLQAGSASRPATATQRPTSDQDVQSAAGDLREAIRQNLSQQAIHIRAQAAAQAAAAQAADGAPPAPAAPGQIRIQRPDGQTVISVPPFAHNNEMPQQAVDISIAFFITVAAIIIGLPLARAFARRMDRRGGTPQIPAEVSAQLTQLNHAVDAIALEVERISEGQRFATKLLAEQRDSGRQTLRSGADR